MYIPIGPTKKQLYKIIIALLLLCYLIFIGMYKPKAEEYNLYSGVLSPKLCRAYYNGGLIDAQVDNFKECQFNTGINTIQEISIFFDTLTYNGYKGYFYEFTGSLNAFNANVVIVNSFIGNSSDTLVGSCNTTTNSTGQITAFTSLCWIPGGLSSGMYSNIFHLQIAHTTGGESPFNVKLQLKDRFTLYNNFYGSNANSSAITNIQNNTQNISNNLNDSSIDNNSANDFTSNSAFQDSNGLDAIIKAPLNFIQSLTSSSCSSISLTIPYIDANVSLPCMSTIYNKALGQQLVNLIALVINGVVLYRYCLKILQIVKDAKNPNKDGLEVLDL